MNRNRANVTIRKIQSGAEGLLFAWVSLQFTLYAALSLRALFFPDHCAEIIGFSVCLN
jgi:hypothetical protein